MYMAKIIHTDLTVAGCSSWSYWTAMSVERWSQKNRFELIKTTPAGGNYSDDFTKEGTVEATPNLWILGNYSLFIRPGYTRVDLTLDETKDFFGSAWMAPDNSRLVVVYSNFNKERGVKLTENRNLPSEVKSIYTYTTSSEKNLKQAQFNVKDEVFIDPYSTTTVVYNF
jgi:O-glycosyl hydrolase